MNLSDVMKYGHLTVRRTVEAVPPNEWETPNVCGVWSSRQIITHLASFERLLLDVLRGFTGGGPTPDLNNFLHLGNQRFNDVEVANRDNLDPEQALGEYEAVHVEAMELAARIAPERYREPGSLPWYGHEYALDDFVCYTFYGHKREHMAQINVFLDVLKGQGKLRRPE
jgi:hypothetical protein